MRALAFSNLWQQKFRLVLGIGGTARPLTPIVLPNGFLTSTNAQVAAYLDSTPVDLFITQDGVTNPLSATALMRSGMELDEYP